MTPNDLHFLVALSVPGGNRDTRTTMNGDRPVRIGPRCSRFCRSWSGPIFRKFFLFLVRFGPRVRNFSWSWSGPVQVLKLLFVLVRSEIPGFGPGSIGFGRWIREGNASNWYGWVYFRLYSGKVSNFWISKKKSINLIFYQKITPVAIIWATYAMRGRRYLQKYSSICG